MLDKFRPNDKIISILNEDEAKKLKEIEEQIDLCDVYRRKMIRAHNKSQAMKIMFWEDMMEKYEQCETAAIRGKMLSTCEGPNKEALLVERHNPGSVIDISFEIEEYDEEEYGDDDDY